MPIVEWNNSFSIGIKEFDEHHRHLISLLNMTFDGITENAPEDELGAVLDELIDYATYHFSLEECWMKQHAYPGLDAHILEHGNFSRRIVEIQNDFHTGRALLDMEVLNFLTDWLIEHILGTDSLYGTYIASKGLPAGVDLSKA